MRIRSLALLLTLAAAPGVAGAQGMGTSQGSRSGGIAAVEPFYQMFKGWIIASAEQMAESNYSFKPTPEVRSFGEIIGHLANENYLFCAAAIGENDPNKGHDFEKVTSKDEMVQGIKAAFAYCDKAYQMPDEKLMEPVTFFGQRNSRLWVLNFNVTHDAEHYGNLITYLRLKGMVPPSSQRSGM